MGLDFNDNYVDDRGPVIFQGISEETIGFKPSKSAFELIRDLEDGGARVIGSSDYTITFVYDQPNVSVSTTNRFVEHETVDGPIIRQKVGRGKKNITIEGVCTTAEAILLDNFVNEDEIYVDSHRYEGDVSIQGISTSPLEDGGAMNLDGKYTHDFGLELTEIEQ